MLILFASILVQKQSDMYDWAAQGLAEPRAEFQAN
jgi:hypothetical protein